MGHVGFGLEFNFFSLLDSTHIYFYFPLIFCPLPLNSQTEILNLHGNRRQTRGSRMSEEMDKEPLGNDELGKRLAGSILVIALIIAISYALYLGASYEGVRATFYMIAGIATISLAGGILIALWAKETKILLYLSLPYAVLIFAGPIYYMVLLSSIDPMGILFVLFGHWGIAYIIWKFRELQSPEQEME
jgi:hypothetical protein